MARRAKRAQSTRRCKSLMVVWTSGWPPEKGQDGEPVQLRWAESGSSVTERTGATVLRRYNSCSIDFGRIGSIRPPPPYKFILNTLEEVIPFKESPHPWYIYMDNPTFVHLPVTDPSPIRVPSICFSPLRTHGD